MGRKLSDIPSLFLWPSPMHIKEYLLCGIPHHSFHSGIVTTVLNHNDPMKWLHYNWIVTQGQIALGRRFQFVQMPFELWTTKKLPNWLWGNKQIVHVFGGNPNATHSTFMRQRHATFYTDQCQMHLNTVCVLCPTNMPKATSRSGRKRIDIELLWKDQLPLMSSNSLHSLGCLSEHANSHYKERTGCFQNCLFPNKGFFANVNHSEC